MQIPLHFTISGFCDFLSLWVSGFESLWGLPAISEAAVPPALCPHEQKGMLELYIVSELPVLLCPVFFAYAFNISLPKENPFGGKSVGSLA